MSTLQIKEERKMKKIKLFYSFIGISLLVSSLVGCEEKPVEQEAEEDNTSVPVLEQKGSAVSETVSYYNNNDFNDYIAKGGSKLDNQWDNYGVSSPYIMKFNGYYYLYSSTTSNTSENGVRAWKSRDLLNWAPVSTEGLKPGYVIATTCGESAKARAPEVYYYNGNFYMYESYNEGTGHFVLKSSSPEGPFTALSKAVVDNKKDGTVVMGKNENPYFFTASKGAINISTMQGMEAIIDTNLSVSGTEVDSKIYAESPAVFDQNGKYYLLYSTGYDTLTGYHVNYAVSDGWENETPSDVALSFRKGQDNLLLNTNTEQGFVGLGHPSVVLGPNLDSHYIVYDSINSATYNNHSLNIDRLLVDNDLVTTKHNRFNSIKPELPTFSTDDKSGLKKYLNYYLSPTATENTFSVEYNFVSAQNAELVFSFADINNYTYIKVDMNSGLKLCQKVNGVARVLKELDFYNYFLNEDHHSIMVNYRDGKLDLHFENSLKISQFEVELSGGKIGYLASNELEIRYTCFSNVAGGLSDQKEFKQAASDIPSLLYIEDDNNISESVVEGDNTHLTTNHKHLSLKHNEYARYNVNFNKDANYGIEFLVSSKLQEKKVIVEIDDQENIVLELPHVNTTEKFMKVKVGDIFIKKGLHHVKIQGLYDNFEFITFSFKENTSKDYVINSKLTSENELRNLRFFPDSRWNFVDNKMVSLNNYRNIALSDEDNISDFDLSVKMALIGSDSIFSESSEAGIIFRCSEYVSYENFMDTHSDITMWNNRYYSVQGYYLAFTHRKVSLYRFDCTPDNSVCIGALQYSLGSAKEKTIILKVRGVRFDLFVDNKSVATYFDSFGFTNGAVGLYATGAEVSYQNLKVVVK